MREEGNPVLWCLKSLKQDPMLLPGTGTDTCSCTGPHAPQILWWQTFSSDFQAEVDAQPGIFDGPEGAKVRQGAREAGGVGRLVGGKVRARRPRQVSPLPAPPVSGAVVRRAVLCQPPPSETGRADLKLRVVEHNLGVVAEYYARITLARLAQLLALGEDDAERRLCDMVTAGKLRAKLDRPAGTVTFADAAAGGGDAGSAALAGWVHGIERLLETVEKTCQKIQKESMVHRVPIGAA